MLARASIQNRTIQNNTKQNTTRQNNTQQNITVRTSIRAPQNFIGRWAVGPGNRTQHDRTAQNRTAQNKLPKSIAAYRRVKFTRKTAQYRKRQNITKHNRTQQHEQDTTNQYQIGSNFIGRWAVKPRAQNRTPQDNIAYYSILQNNTKQASKK